MRRVPKGKLTTLDELRKALARRTAPTLLAYHDRHFFMDSRARRSRSGR